MLSDVGLKRLKKGEIYEVSDRDGMYVSVALTGRISFRYDYRLSGRRETLTIGHYGEGGIPLAEARVRCADARKLVASRISPAHEKKRAKRRNSLSQDFASVAGTWLKEVCMAESTRSMRKSVLDRDIFPVWKNRFLSEITAEYLRQLCKKVKARRAPATAIHVRYIVKLIYSFAILNGERLSNPGEEVMPASIATFAPKDRALPPAEIRIMLQQPEYVPTLPTIRLGLRLILLTMVHKSELTDAVWDESDFENAVWTIPKERMKRSKAHNVYLSQQSLDIMIALKTCAGDSRYLLPSRYDSDSPMSRATFNRITAAVTERAMKEELPLAAFTVHDLRRTGSTLLNEIGSTVTGSKNASRTKTAIPQAASITRPSMNLSAGICFRSGPT